MKSRRNFLRHLALAGAAAGGSTQILYGHQSTKPWDAGDSEDRIISNQKTGYCTSVVDAGINNDGHPIGPELNELIKSSYLQTLYFPAGVYNLTEPMVLPYDYTKNVNLLIDPNAIIKAHYKLESLLKIGYSELSTPDVTQRRFSYIEGGQFDCSNVEHGIMVNGLKQLVSLKYITLYKGQKSHIRISVTDDFKGTGSSDTKIDNISIQGDSSNDEVYGIYIDKSCHDCKISNTFIYGTKCAIFTRSAGQIINNVHILSWVVHGGKWLPEGQQFRGTEGIRFEMGGFYILNEVYFDTVDKSIVIIDGVEPRIIVDKCIFYSYLENFGSAFICKAGQSLKPFQIKISNSIMEVRNDGYKIFDIAPQLIARDLDHDFSHRNYVKLATHRLDPYDVSLAQRVRGVQTDVLISGDVTLAPHQWYVIGAVIASAAFSKLRLDLTFNASIELDIKYSFNKVPIIRTHNQEVEDSTSYELGFSVKGDFCVLCIKPIRGTIRPVVNDLLGCGTFMCTPSKDRVYNLPAYGVEEVAVSPILIKKHP